MCVKKRFHKWETQLSVFYILFSRLKVEKECKEKGKGTYFLNNKEAEHVVIRIATFKLLHIICFSLKFFHQLLLQFSLIEFNYLIMYEGFNDKRVL